MEVDAEPVEALVGRGERVVVAAIEACVAERQESGEVARFLIGRFEGAALLARATGDHGAPLRHVGMAIDVLSA